MADITGTLTMCRRAGKLVLGMDEVKNACKGGRAFGVLAASDVSPKTLKGIKYVCAMEGVKLYGAGMTMDEIGSCLGKCFGILAVTDSGFMRSMAKRLIEIKLDLAEFEY